MCKFRDIEGGYWQPLTRAGLYGRRALSELCVNGDLDSRHSNIKCDKYYLE